MTGPEFARIIRYNTRTTETTFTNQQIIDIANMKARFLVKKIESVDEDFFGSPETKDLVASSTTREYPLPSDNMARIEKVEAMLDGENWVILKEFDLTQHDRPTNEQSILDYFSNEQGNAFFDIYRNSLWLYTGEITATTNGLKLWSFAYPAKLTVEDLADDERELSEPKTADDNGIPEDFHELWIDLVCIHYKSNKDKPIPLTQQERAWKENLKELLMDLRQINRDRAFVAGAPDVSDWGDNGANY